MKGRSVIETVLGAVVLIVALVFLVSAYKGSDIQPVSGYPLSARFNSVDGLAAGNDVRIGGVKIGSVEDMAIDPQTYAVVVKMTVADNLKLPEDSFVSITSDGLLGGKYVRIEPGQSQKLLEPNGQLTRTRDVVVLEQVLGRAIFLLTEQ